MKQTRPQTFAILALLFALGCATPTPENTTTSPASRSASDEATLPSKAPVPASQPASAPAASINNALLRALPRPKGLEGAAAINTAQIEADVRFLADDTQRGRGLGDRGIEASARYIAARFADAGLEPAGDPGTYFQTFSVITGSALEAAARQNLTVAGQTLAYDRAWRPFAFSKNGDVEAEVVFAGYGINAPEQGYDDYEGLDVQGRIVVVLRHEPEFKGPHGSWSRGKPGRWSDLRYKAHVARKKGAAAILIVNGPATYKANPERDQLRLFEGTSQSDILAAHLTHRGAERAMKALNIDIEAIQKQIDAEGRPASRALNMRARLQVSITRRRATVKNVVGRITPATEDLADAVIIGAHYDHLGYGGDASLRPESQEIHNGADDNASGTALLMELAEALAAGPAPRRAVYVVAFTAEEIGLLGAQYFVEHPPVPVEQMAAMINFDMVGRLRDDTLYVSGVGTSSMFASLTHEAADGTGLTIAPNRDGYGPSDHSAFYAQKVPVLAMFTGVHDQYHTPDDDIDLVNIPGIARVARYAYRVTRYLCDAPDTPTYVAQPMSHGGDSGGSGGRGYGPYFGSVPSFSDMGGGGVKIQGVRAGSPAEIAGLKADDVVVAFGSAAIHDLYDYTYALREHRVGDRVRVTVLRDGARVTLEAVLGARKAQSQGETP